MVVYSREDIDRALSDEALEIGREEGEVQIGPSSVDVHLGDEFTSFERTEGLIDPADEDSYPPMTEERVVNGVTTIEPKEFMLAHTEEWISIPDNLISVLCGVSSVGRLGLFIENAGLVDAGFRGQLTLELFNATDNEIILRPGMRIGQLTFHEHKEAPEESYGPENHRYQGQSGVTPSRAHESE